MTRCFTCALGSSLSLQEFVHEVWGTALAVVCALAMSGVLRGFVMPGPLMKIFAKQAIAEHQEASVQLQEADEVMRHSITRLRMCAVMETLAGVRGSFLLFYFGVGGCMCCILFLGGWAGVCP